MKNLFLCLMVICGCSVPSSSTPSDVTPRVIQVVETTPGPLDPNTPTTEGTSMCHEECIGNSECGGNCTKCSKYTGSPWGKGVCIGAVAVKPEDEALYLELKAQGREDEVVFEVVQPSAAAPAETDTITCPETCNADQDCNAGCGIGYHCEKLGRVGVCRTGHPAITADEVKTTTDEVKTFQDLSAAFKPEPVPQTVCSPNQCVSDDDCWAQCGTSRAFCSKQYPTFGRCKVLSGEPVAPGAP